MTSPHAWADRRFRQFCETGDPEALGDVFDRTSGSLIRVALWLAANRTDAEDLLQRTFLKAIETRRQFRSGAPVVPWLMGLLGNEARRQRRERDRAATVRCAPDRVVDPEQAVVARELADTVRSVGDRLGSPYGEVLRLHLEDGLTCDEIAAHLRRRAGTAGRPRPAISPAAGRRPPASPA
ncbi:MAG TPA: sigma-70 family RNA polymerase sigma factor [Planctomycetota bacterium]|nr:sigma-70 family RNA polymerase sigma factor [Planctomycetota bacterium]